MSALTPPAACTLIVGSGPTARTHHHGAAAQPLQPTPRGGEGGRGRERGQQQTPTRLDPGGEGQGQAARNAGSQMSVFSPVLTGGRGGGELSGVFSSRRALTPFLQSPPSWPSWTTPGGIRFQHVNLGGHTHSTCSTQHSARRTGCARQRPAGNVILQYKPACVICDPGPDPGPDPVCRTDGE